MHRATLTLIAAACALLAVAPAPAQTLLPGFIGSNTTLTAAGNPHLLTGSTTVSPLATLTLEPGVEVVAVGETAQLHVFGTIDVQRGVTINAGPMGEPGDWAGLAIDGGVAELSGCTIEHAGATNAFGVRAAVAVRNRGSATLDGVTLRSTSGPGPDAGLWLQGSTASLTGCTLEALGNDPAEGDIAVASTGGDTLSIALCEFIGNAAYAARVEAPNFPTFTGNTFSGGARDRILLYGLSPFGFQILSDLTIPDAPGLEGYEVEARLVAAPQADVVIEPGVTFYCRTDVFIEFLGSVEAIGSEDDPITFTSSDDNGPGTWNAVYLIGGNESATAAFRHCIIEHAGGPPDNPNTGEQASLVMNEYGTASLEFCQIRSAGGEYGIFAEDAEGLSLENCTVDGAGTKFAIDTEVSFALSDSTISNTPGVALRCRASSLSEIKDNTFIGNTENNIRLFGSLNDGVTKMNRQLGLDAFIIEGTVSAGDATVEIAAGVHVGGGGVFQAGFQAQGTPLSPVTIGTPGTALQIRCVDPSSFSHTSFAEADSIKVLFGAHADFDDCSFSTTGVRLEASSAGFTACDFYAGGEAIQALFDSDVTHVRGCTFHPADDSYELTLKASELRGLEGLVFPEGGEDEIDIRGDFGPWVTTLAAWPGLDFYAAGQPIAIPADATVNIEPGVTLFLTPDEFVVEGALHALGTSGSRITLLSPFGKGWERLLCDGCDLTLDNVEVYRAGRPTGDERNAIKLTNGAVAELTNVRITQIGNHGVDTPTYEGIFCEDSTLTMKNCTLDPGVGDAPPDTGNCAIMVRGASVATLTDVNVLDSILTGIIVESGEATWTGGEIRGLVGDALRVLGGSGAFHSLEVSGNTGFGLLNLSDNPVEACCIWWGSALGPINPANPGGQGEEVSGQALFLPFLKAPVDLLVGPCLAGDLNADLVIDIDDLLIALDRYPTPAGPGVRNQPGAAGPPGVDDSVLQTVISAFGEQCQ